MKKSGLLMMAVLASGCSISNEEFQDRYREAACALAFECDPDSAKFFGDEATCNQFMVFAYTQINADEGCEYNADNAKECLDFVENADCTDYGSGEIDVCDNVYEGDECGSSSDDTGQ